MKSAKKTKLKKFSVDVASSENQIIGVRRMNCHPALRWPRSAGSVGGSTGEIRLSANAEATNENASTTSAAGADRICTIAPPRLGPPTYENARLPLRSEFASTYRSRGTSEVNSVL